MIGNNNQQEDITDIFRTYKEILLTQTENVTEFIEETTKLLELINKRMDVIEKTVHNLIENTENNAQGLINLNAKIKLNKKEK
jgi:hypothetical protein|tara:strand:+ start:280 stop:528 length:249 start_codon:yes stop_codon:yes gene_type:complete